MLLLLLYYYNYYYYYYYYYYYCYSVLIFKKFYIMLKRKISYKPFVQSRQIVHQSARIRQRGKFSRNIWLTTSMMRISWKSNSILTGLDSSIAGCVYLLQFLNKSLQSRVSFVSTAASVKRRKKRQRTKIDLEHYEHFSQPLGIQAGSLRVRR